MHTSLVPLRISETTWLVVIKHLDSKSIEG